MARVDRSGCIIKFKFLFKFLFAEFIEPCKFLIFRFNFNFLKLEIGFSELTKFKAQKKSIKKSQKLFHGGFRLSKDLWDTM